MITFSPLNHATKITTNSIMNLQQASLTDYESVLSFYDDVTARTPEIGRYARWQKGTHPTADGIKSYIQEGSLYLLSVSV